MNVYIYQAALLCEGCGEAQREHLDEAFKASGAAPGTDEDNSNRYPQGPYSDGGGEADSPQHCDQCSVFLENPLTPDGEDYVRYQWNDKLFAGPGDPAVLLEWIDGYSYLWADFKEEIEKSLDRMERGE
jgi:hypothetical protein